MPAPSIGSLITDWPFEAPSLVERRERRIAWVRGLLVALATVLPTPTGDEPRHASPPEAGTGAQPALRTGDLWQSVRVAVRQRFVLAATVRDCRHTENLYGFNLLRAAADDGERAALDGAAREGAQAPVTPATGDDACAAALSALDSADDGLLLLAERIGRGER